MIPDYTIRESVRAKHVRLKVTVADGLVVVIPKGFNRCLVPGLIEQKRAWLNRALDTIEEHRATLLLSDLRPDSIELRAVDQKWLLDWDETSASGAVLSETDGFELQIQGATQDVAVWRPALRRWVMDQGQRVLVPWVNDISRDLGIPIQRVTIRCQKTRWGSYSAKGTVSLNAQLLFLPRRLARYVLVHEVCHAIHTNHAPQFWSLVRQWEPEADRLRSELKTAAWLVPSWLRSNY